MLVYFACYGAGMLFASSAHSYLSGFSLMFAAVCLYFQDYRRSGNPLHLRALFSLFFVGGEGVSCLKLSRLQTEWDPVTWASLFVAFTAFWAAFELMELWSGAREIPVFSAARQTKNENRSVRYADRLFLSMAGLTAVSLAAFILEAAVLGYIPLFVRGVPHAYSYFHISGVHYFTVSCVLVPSLAVLYCRYGRGERQGKLIAAAVCSVIAVLIPMLCVSRFQLVFAVILAVLTYMIANRKLELSYLAAAVLVLIPFYIVLTVARSHDVAYLNGIFEMKNPNTPIFITQPYMYIANNYDNFNCLVEELPRHALGVKGLFPLWALTGLKFIKPELAAYPIFTTKEELTTVTLFYDAYYDFGIVGVFLFSCALGAVAAYLVRLLGRMRNPAGYLLYAQIALYLMLSFFTTWFSNPTTWFYLAVTGAVALFLEIDVRRK